MSFFQKILGLNNGEVDRAIRFMDAMHRLVDSGDYNRSQSYWDNDNFISSSDTNVFDVVGFINSNLMFQEGFSEKTLMDKDVAIRIFGVAGKLKQIHQ